MKDLNIKEASQIECKKCKGLFFAENFYVNNGKKLGRNSSCKECDKKAMRKYNKENKLKRALYSINKLYGIDKEEYEKMLLQQNSQCKICKIPAIKLTKRLFIDHCHKTGLVRGLLCHKCNTVLGYVDDNIKTLEQAIRYLKGDL